MSSDYNYRTILEVSCRRFRKGSATEALLTRLLAHVEWKGSDPTQQTAIDNFMFHELMEPKTSGAGAIKSLESM
ncbi:hypothetical protein DY000_02007702 [Brassica cretica]|uniref:Uncharacterized protein n=1 Tax=Brassica cretica TaxID=69181 RepID=A0ABQ7C963_BRACR|nr:hypothetical protein DY000_02007702 [Brassica cretica]